MLNLSKVVFVVAALCVLPLDPGMAQTEGQPPIEACKPGNFTVVGYPDEFRGKSDPLYDVLVDTKFDGGFLTAQRIWLPAIRRALSTWNSVPNSTVRFSELRLSDAPASSIDGKLTISPCGFDFICPESVPTPPGEVPPDIIRVPSLERQQGTTLAVTLITTDRSFGRPIRDADIFFNASIPFQTNPSAGQIDFENVLLHELGHAIGLGHNDNCSVGPTIMESVVDLGPKSHALGSPEVEGARFLYPEPGAARIQLFEADSAVVFSASVGQPAPFSRSIEVFGIEGDRWIATVSTQSGGDWLSVSPTVGRFSGDRSIEVSADSTALAVGQYSGTLSLAVDGVANDPVVVPVTLTVDGAQSTIRPTISEGGIVNGANMLTASLAPGSIVSVFGSSMSSAVSVAEEVPLPRALADTSLVISGVVAPLFFVSESQINAQVPYESLDGRTQLVVRTSRGNSIPLQATISPAAPEFFLAGDNNVLALNLDGTVNSQAQPIAGGAKLSLFLTGLGSVDPPVPTGAAAPVGPLAWTRQLATAQIGGRPAEVLFAGLAPGFVGLGQVDLLVPVGLTGRLALRVSVGGSQSPVGFIWVQ